MNDVNKSVGRKCADFRKNVLGISQSVVARDCGCTRVNISSFEHGKNNNNRIFLWYVKYGILNYYSVDELVGYYE